MSDLGRGTLPTAGSSRAQNGGTTRNAPAVGPELAPTEPPRYRTPTDVMRERRLREARRAEEAARLRQEEERRRLQHEQVVGVGDDPARGSTIRTGTQTAQAFNIGGPSAQSTRPSTRRPENIPPAPTGTSRLPGRPPPLSATTQHNRTEAFEQLNIPASARPAVPLEQVPRASQPPPNPAQSGAQSGPRAGPPPEQPSDAGAGGRSRFPNAFERWEDLSAHWEGIVSSFIHRLENNAEELAEKSINRQMARQVEDLSAAGANLFHAVVELQRLRASSERKFQRWFFETRHESEKDKERQAELERQLRTEQEARTHNSTVLEAARADKTKADELVKEMRRELQISKEEARRAWEELGRREQEERDRTIALRSGEPTLIGGVQVVPMQGMPSRQVSTAQRPQTRDGPTAAAGPTTLSGQQQQQRPPSRSQTTTTSLDSPGEESRQFSFRPDQAHSPTVTDPFTESSRQRDQQAHLRREPDTQFYTSPTRPAQTPNSAAAIAAARVATSGGPSPGRTVTDPRYYPARTTNAQISGSLPAPIRSGTGGTEQSFIPSTASAASEEEYHINPDGSYIRDAQGRRIPYSQPIGPGPSGLSEQISDDEGEMPGEISEDDDDHTADMERERMYAAQYRPNQSSQQQPPSTIPASIPHTTAGALPSIPQGRSVDPGSPDYEGAGYDPTPPVASQTQTAWELRHRHPTRLSDISEEHTARTSPSRTSYVSGAGLFPGEALGGAGEPSGRR